MIRRRRIALLAWLLIAIAPEPVAGGVLVEARHGRNHLVIEIGGDPDRLLLRLDGEAYVADLARERLISRARGREIALAPPQEPQGFELSTWGRGSRIAGHASAWNVLTRDQQTCGETLASRWMTPFLEPAAKLIGMLEATGLLTMAGGPADCGGLPFAALARNGWPLEAGSLDTTLFRTRRLLFDHDRDPHAFLLAGEITPAACAP